MDRRKRERMRKDLIVALVLVNVLTNAIPVLHKLRTRQTGAPIANTK